MLSCRVTLGTRVHNSPQGLGMDAGRKISSAPLPTQQNSHSYWVGDQGAWGENKC